MSNKQTKRRAVCLLLHDSKKVGKQQYSSRPNTQPNQAGIMLTRSSATAALLIRAGGGGGSCQLTEERLDSLRRSQICYAFKLPHTHTQKTQGQHGQSYRGVNSTRAATSEQATGGHHTFSCLYFSRIALRGQLLALCCNSRRAYTHAWISALL
jgi:hypothetical protein